MVICLILYYYNSLISLYVKINLDIYQISFCIKKIKSYTTVKSLKSPQLLLFEVQQKS